MEGKGLGAIGRSSGLATRCFAIRRKGSLVVAVLDAGLGFPNGREKVSSNVASEMFDMISEKEPGDLSELLDLWVLERF